MELLAKNTMFVKLVVMKLSICGYYDLRKLKKIYDVERRNWNEQ
jgi:hypothetical protein